MKMASRHRHLRGRRASHFEAVFQKAVPPIARFARCSSGPYRVFPYTSGVSATAAELGVGAVVYRVTASRLAATWIAPDGRRDSTPLASLGELIPALEKLRAELTDGMALANGAVPRLRAFIEDWGRRLLPDALATDPPDVLVLVPHALLHDVPLHLVGYDDGIPLGCRVGVTYTSGLSLYARCAARNRGRWNPPPQRALAAGGTDVLSGRSEMFQAVPRQLARLFGDRVRYLEIPERGLTRSAVKDAVHDEPDVLVLVAHGHLHPTNHRLSGLLVDPPDDVGWQTIALRPGQRFEFRDLPLTPVPPLSGAVQAEVLTLAELDLASPLRTELVMLLACSTGTGRGAAGDEPVSLAEAVLRLGAASVIAPLWDADFAATRDWVEEFVAGWLIGGRCKALAARDATARVWASTGGRPELAGALTIRGDWV